MTATTITIPDLALVVLIGPSGAGKSSFAARHFAPSEVLSSDFCRLLVADDGFGTVTVVGVVLRPAGSVVDPSHTLTGPDGSPTPEAFL